MTMEERLENLERKMRRGRQLNLCLSAALCVCLGVWALSGGGWKGANTASTQPAEQKEMRTRKFVLEDENGKIRAVLAVGNDGPALALYDERGVLRAGLLLGKDGPALLLSDERGKPRAGLLLLKDEPGLVLRDERGKPRAMFTVVEDAPKLELYDEQGKAIWEAP